MNGQLLIHLFACMVDAVVLVFQLMPLLGASWPDLYDAGYAWM